MPRIRARVYDYISSLPCHTVRAHDCELNYVSLYRVTMRSQNYTGNRHVVGGTCYSCNEAEWFHDETARDKRIPCINPEAAVNHVTFIFFFIHAELLSFPRSRSVRGERIYLSVGMLFILQKTNYNRSQRTTLIPIPDFPYVHLSWINAMEARLSKRVFQNTTSSSTREVA